MHQLKILIIYPIRSAGMGEMEKNNTTDSFLCGGNAEDPLNLEGLFHPDQITPHAKRFRGLPNKDPVIIPSILNVKNPLNLVLDIDNLEVHGNDKNSNLKLENNKLTNKTTSDPIVSPVVSLKQLHTLQKRKRNGSENASNNNKHLKEPQNIDNNKKPKNTKLKSSNNYIYGNYPAYYNYRNLNKESGNTFPDLRVNVIQKNWVKNKKVLDIGCNVGYITQYIAKTFQPSQITGIDIDENLIKRARYNVLQDLEHSKHVKKSPASLRFPSKLHLYPPYSVDNMHLFPYNMEFMTANYVCECQELLDMQSPEYNVILCLSVSKWIHLNWGDQGLKRTFKRIYNQLHDNSLFIFEPQEWTSYKKAKKKNKQKYDHLTFRPHHFKSYLLNDLGFSYVKAFYPEKSASVGFDRTIYVYLKCQKDKVEDVVKELHLEGGEYKCPRT